MHGLLRHLGQLSCIPFPCMSHRLGSKTRFLLSSRLGFSSCPSEYLSQVGLIYSIVCLLDIFLQPKMCGASAAGHSHLSKAWRSYWWLRARSLFLWSLVSGGKSRQACIQSCSKEPARNVRLQSSLGRTAHPTGRYDTKPSFRQAVTRAALRRWQLQELKVGRRQA